MTEMQIELKNIVIHAIAAFNEKESYLITRDLSERCICAKFAQYLDREVKQTEYSDYETDVEYNRGSAGDEYALKRSDEGKLIVTDLIVHKRGKDAEYGFDNLICIEMKKTKAPSKLISDLERLLKMTDNNYGFCYKIGFMIIVNKKEGVLKVHQLFVNEQCWNR